MAENLEVKNHRSARIWWELLAQLWGPKRKITCPISHEHGGQVPFSKTVQLHDTVGWEHNWENSQGGSHWLFPFRTALAEEPAAWVRVKHAIESRCSWLCYLLTSPGPHLHHLFPKHLRYFWALCSALPILSEPRPDHLLWPPLPSVMDDKQGR